MIASQDRFNELDKDVQKIILETEIRDAVRSVLQKYGYTGINTLVFLRIFRWGYWKYMWWKTKIYVRGRNEREIKL